MLNIQNLKVNRDNSEILKGVNLTIGPSELHVLMGPNGSGKSTLALTLMGHPSCNIINGDVLLDGKSIANLSPDKRAKKGLFLAFQYPVEVPGVSMRSFIRTAYKELEKPLDNFNKALDDNLKILNMEKSFLQRSLNDNFSGGEKKKGEILQMAVLKPKYAVLDETDSGLDVSALKVVSKAIETVRKKNSKMGILLITHYSRILKHLNVNFVHIMSNGKIIKSGGRELAEEVEERGYDK